jgi:glycerol-3-phosphate dehydrogenase
MTRNISRRCSTTAATPRFFLTFLSRHAASESDLATALAASRDILVVVPSHVFGQVLRQIKPLMRPDARLVWATKGLEAETGACCRTWRVKRWAMLSRWR